MSILTLLQQSLPARSFGPETSEYDAGRTVFAGAGSPDAVVRPHTVDEVAAAVRAAASLGTPIAVRSGGHGSAPVEGGLVIDLAAFDAIEVLPPEAGGEALVSVGSAAHWGDVAAALAPHGLGLSSGDTNEVGVGGLALGGGVGWLVRQQGLTVDALRAVELVTAAGEVLTVDETHHPELFWGLRGGGGNFGVATRFTFQTVPVDGLVGGHLRFDEADASAVMHAWREVIRADGEVNTSLLVMPAFAPGMPAGPMVAFARRGTEAEVRAALAPLLELPSLTETQLGQVAYTELLEPAPPGRPPFRFVGGNGFMPEVSDDLIDAAAALLARPVPTMLMLRALGGAYSAVPADATAIAFRPAEALFMINAVLPPDASDELVAEVEAANDTALAHRSGVYGNFSEERGEHVIAAMYPPETLARLRRLKASLDPANLFRHGHDIAPA